jgi:tRNA(Ile)-lysidine synthase
MAGLEPFETPPRLAVAVSGGADSLALVLLCHRWACRRGGEVIGLTVDHRLRAESEAEARQVGKWLARQGIAHRRLVWERLGGRPTSAIQAAARTARYRLLADWCRRRGLLHLALAHHAGDQAETVLMRLARGGGLDGLAGMASIAGREGVRLIRPLLTVAPARLRATLGAARQGWIEDPSNSDPGFERIRWRNLIPCDLAPGISGAAAEIGEERRRREGEVADLLAAARIGAAGFIELPLAELKAAAPEIAQRAVARCLIVVGGDAYPPARESLARLLAMLDKGSRGRTLGGCRVLFRGTWLLICREPDAARERFAVRPGIVHRWDGRFLLEAATSGEIARLGDDGWQKLPVEARHPALPREVVPGLPALWRGGRPIAVPHLNYGSDIRWTGFRPAQSLVPGRFTVAKLNVNIM